VADADGHPERDEMTLGAILLALADPLRRHVVVELAQAPEGTERTCASFGLPVSKASLTHHFRVLREAGLIRQIDRGNNRAAKLRRKDIEARFPGLLALIATEAAQDDGTHESTRAREANRGRESKLEPARPGGRSRAERKTRALSKSAKL
jgi:DNA-binding transcriptional ArsR family regulator